MGGRKAGEDFFAFRGELEADLAAIFLAAEFAGEFQGGETVRESHDAVVLGLEAFGEFADADGMGAGKAFDGEESLVLLWSDAGGQCGFFAKAQEAAEGVAKGGEKLVIFQGDGSQRVGHVQEMAQSSQQIQLHCIVLRPN